MVDAPNSSKRQQRRNIARSKQSNAPARRCRGSSPAQTSVAWSNTKCVMFSQSRLWVLDNQHRLVYEIKRPHAAAVASSTPLAACLNDSPVARTCAAQETHPLLDGLSFSPLSTAAMPTNASGLSSIATICSSSSTRCALGAPPFATVRWPAYGQRQSTPEKLLHWDAVQCLNCVIAAACP